MPTATSFDFKGDRIGNDAVVLSSDLTQFSYLKGDKILVIIGARAKSANTTFSLMNWGPNAYEQSFINFTDISIATPQNV